MTRREETAARVGGLWEEAFCVSDKRLEGEKKARAAFSLAGEAEVVRFFERDFRQLLKKHFGAADAERSADVPVRAFVAMPKVGVARR